MGRETLPAEGEARVEGDWTVAKAKSNRAGLTGGGPSADACPEAIQKQSGQDGTDTQNSKQARINPLPHE